MHIEKTLQFINIPYIIYLKVDVSNVIYVIYRGGKICVIERHLFLNIIYNDK